MQKPSFRRRAHKSTQGDPRLTSQRERTPFPRKAEELKHSTCPGRAEARSSGPAPPSPPQTGVEGLQNVTGPRLSAPKRDPPPGDRDAVGRSLPFLSPPAQSSFILEAGSPSCPAGYPCTANPTAALSPARPETGARIRARAQTPPPRTWGSPGVPPENPSTSQGARPEAARSSLAASGARFARSCSVAGRRTRASRSHRRYNSSPLGDPCPR